MSEPIWQDIAFIESSAVPEGDAWFMSRAPSHAPFERQCEVCGKRSAVVVLGSALGAWSRAFCAECAADPESEMRQMEGGYA